MFDLPLQDAVKQPPPHIEIPNTAAIPNMQGFVKDYAVAIEKAKIKAKKHGQPPLNVNPDLIMNCFGPESLPVINSLAQNYAVCDQWYSSVPTQTFPNRSFVHAATSSGNVYNKWDTGRFCWNIPGIFINDTPTIYNLMQDKVSWKVYHGGPLFLYNTLIIQRKLWDYVGTENFSPVCIPGLFNKHTFYSDLDNNKLPAYSFIEPNMICSEKYGAENDMHPAYAITEHGAPTDVRYGDKLIYDIFDALRNSSYWNKTLLVITFDEHGGCFDHMPTPDHPAVPPGDKLCPYTNGWNGGNGFDFKRLGVRVPAVVVSPWIEEGTISHTQFDHTSIIKTATNKWLNGQNLTQRDKHATDLSELLSRATVRTDSVDIVPQKPPKFCGCADKPLSELQQNTIMGAAKLAKHHGLKTNLKKLDSTEKATAHFESCAEQLLSR